MGTTSSEDRKPLWHYLRKLLHASYRHAPNSTAKALNALEECRCYRERAIRVQLEVDGWLVTSDDSPCVHMCQLISWQRARSNSAATMMHLINQATRAVLLAPESDGAVYAVIALRVELAAREAAGLADL